MPPSRRAFIKTIGRGALGSGVALNTSTDLVLSSRLNQVFADEPANTIISKIDNTHPVRVNNPVKLGTWELSAERIFVGLGYKPSMAMLPSGELVMVCIKGVKLPGNKFTEKTSLWRSK